MIEKIANGLVNQMLDENVIDKGMAERYVYVLTLWMEKFITIGTIVLISILDSRKRDEDTTSRIAANP